MRVDFCNNNKYLLTRSDVTAGRKAKICPKVLTLLYVVLELANTFSVSGLQVHIDYNSCWC